MKRGRAGCLVLSALFWSGCSSAPTKTELPPLASDAPRASSTPIVPVTAAPPAPPPPSPFTLVAPLDGEHLLFPVDGTVLVVGREAKQMEGGLNASPIGYIDGDKLKFPPEMALGGWFHHVVGIDGKWPDKITMLAVGDTGRAPMAERYTLQGEEWKRAADCHTVDCEVGRRYVGLFNVNGSLLGLEAPGIWPDRAPKFTTFAGPKVTLAWTKPPASCVSDYPMKFPAELWSPAAVGSLSDGTILAYGSRCSGDVAVEMWKQGKGSSTITPIPFGQGALSDGDAQILPAPDGRAWLIDGAIAFFDGTSWAQVDGPAAGESAVSAALAKDGRLWVVTKSGLYVKDKRWEMVELPGDAAATDVVVDRTGVMWVAAAGALFRERKKDEPASELTVTVKKQPPAPAKKPVKPGSAKCKNNVVILYGFTKVTPDDYDFPLTRKAIKGHGELVGVKFVVSKDYGKKFFAGLAPSFDIAKKLSKLIEREVQGSKPAIVCAQPEIVRELLIDLKTGDVRK